MRRTNLFKWLLKFSSRPRGLAIILLVPILLAYGCARIPSMKRSANILRTHFKKYAKKYPETVYAKHRVTEVEITDRQEIHKHLVAVEAFITLDDGDVQKILASVEKGPFGWRFVSWENATGK